MTGRLVSAREIAELPAYRVQRTTTYREMRDRLKAENAALKAENARVRQGMIGGLSAREIRAQPLFQELRAKHSELAARNQQLRAELKARMPLTNAAVFRSEPYQRLRAELREAQPGKRRVQELVRAEEDLRRSERLIARFLPDGARSADVDWHHRRKMMSWHLEEAIAWALKAGVSRTEFAEQARRIHKVIARRGFRGLHGYVPTSLRRELLHEWARCTNCQTRHDLTIDHIVPIARGGKSNRDNLQVLCRKCNSRKGARVE
jgi:5-methylcytosine-specific restriction endonuclease McrA